LQSFAGYKNVKEHFCILIIQRFLLIEFVCLIFSTIIEIHTNFIILYYAALLPNIGVKFRNIGKVIKIEIDVHFINTLRVKPFKKLQ